MAITNNGTINLLPKNQLPTGYVAPKITTFSDYEYSKRFDVVMAKTDIALSTQALTMANLIEDPTEGVNKKVTDAITSDFVATKNVVFFTELRALKSSDTLNGGDDVWLTDAATKYIASVIVYIKSI